MGKQKKNVPCRFRSAAGRAISVESGFMPGKRISTGCYDMAGAVLFAERYICGMGMPNNAPVPTMREFCKDFFTRTGKGSYRDREKAFGRDKQDAYYTRQQARVDNNILPAFGPYLLVLAHPVHDLAVEALDDVEMVEDDLNVRAPLLEGLLEITLCHMPQPRPRPSTHHPRSL